MAAALDAKSTAIAGRLLFIDNIRWLLIVDVIIHHAAVTYSHVGSWYFNDPVQPSRLTGLALGSFEAFNQAFFMGFLFFIAGYFVPRPFDTKGAARFIRDRFLRLGVPSLIYMLVIHPFLVYWMLQTFVNPKIPPLTTAYLQFLTSGRVLAATGPMWFAVALLFFCLVYAAIRSLTPSRAPAATVRPFPSHSQLVLLAFFMGLCSFLVRIVAPIGVSVYNMQPCYFAQYIILFAAGIYAWRNNWLLTLPHSTGITWFRTALIAGPLVWLLILVTSGAAQGNLKPMLGGVHWQSAALAFWESFFCVGISLGLLVLFRDHANRQGAFAQWMSKNSFAAYFLHPPILVAVTLVFKSWNAPVLVRFLVSAAIAVPLTFAISGFLRPRLPGLRRIL